MKIALCYAGLSALWILGSGWLLHYFVPDEARAAWLEVVKGWFFVLVTATLLGLALNRYFREARRSAQDLQENEARLRHMGDNLPDSFVYQYAPGPDGKPRFNYVSAGIERVIGLKPADVLRDANLLFAQIDPAQMPAYAAAEAESARKLTDFEMDLRMRRSDGVLRLVRARSRPRRNAEGQVQWDGYVVDITERKQAELALRESEKNYREIFNATNEAIFLHDTATGRVLDVNDAMLRMYGHSTKEDILSSRFNQTLDDEPPFTLSEARRRIHLAIEEGPQVFEWLARKQNGERFWVEVSLRGSNIGGQGRVLAVVRDISQRKAQELEIERLTRLYATLSQVNQTIVRCQTRKELFDDICRVMIEYGRFRAVQIGERFGDGDGLRFSAHRMIGANPSFALLAGGCIVANESIALRLPGVAQQSAIQRLRQLLGGRTGPAGLPVLRGVSRAFARQCLRGVQHLFR